MNASGIVGAVRTKHTTAAGIAVAASAAIALSLTVWPAAMAVFGVVALAMVGLKGSNFLRDRGIQNSLSRRFAPVVGGLGYLVAVLWLDRWTAVGVSAAMALLIIILRLGFRAKLRGVRGSHPAQAWAEITYPLAGTISLVVAWGILSERWLAFMAIAFMAWGDTASGMARDIISSDRSPTLVTMSAMFFVCVGAAAIFFQPFWIGVVGAAVATLAERYRPGIFGFWDDNLYIVVASLAAMDGLERLSGMQ